MGTSLWHRVIWVKFSSSLSAVAVAGQRADCSGGEQTELGKRKTLRISERVEPWREWGEDQALTSSLPWGTSFKVHLFSQLLNCLL